MALTSHNMGWRGWALLGLAFAITLLCGVEIANIMNLASNPTHKALPSTISPFVAKKDVAKFSIAIGIFSVHRPNAPDYVYYEVMSILDVLMVNQTYISIDKIHVFDGSFNGSQVKYFKYSPHVVVHPMDPLAYTMVERFPVHRKASLNYLLALKYLVPHYGSNVDAYLMLEDDVMFDPHSSLLLHQTLLAVRHLPRFLVDGYVAFAKPGYANHVSGPVVQFKGEAHCCSQAFLLSPLTAKESIPLIEMSLNGSVVYHPLDVFLTSTLLKQANFSFFFATKCWVQHIGHPVMGLGNFHRGCSAMNFEKDVYNQTLDTNC